MSDQDSAARAGDLVELGRGLFGDEWAADVYRSAARLTFDTIPPRIVGDRALSRCGLCQALLLPDDEDDHAGHHLLITAAIRYVGAAGTVALRQLGYPGDPYPDPKNPSP